MSNEQELTPWFPAKARPARKGWYQRQYQLSVTYCHWNGQRWSMGVLNWDDRDIACEYKSAEKFLPWRGLAKEPK